MYAGLVHFEPSSLLTKCSPRDATNLSGGHCTSSQRPCRFPIDHHPYSYPCTVLTSLDSVLCYIAHATGNWFNSPLMDIRPFGCAQRSTPHPGQYGHRRTPEYGSFASNSSGGIIGRRAKSKPLKLSVVEPSTGEVIDATAINNWR